jgi:hypothetical protein
VKNRQIQPGVPRKHWANIKSVVDRQRFDAGPDPNFTHVGKSEIFYPFFTALSVYTVLPFP